MRHQRRRRVIGGLAQSAAGACVGAFFASVVEPPHGARWALLAGGVVLAGVAGWAHANAPADSRGE